MKTRDIYASNKDLDRWRLWKNKVNKLISKAKSSYYLTLLSSNKSNPRTFWKLLNELVPKKSPAVTTVLKINNNSVTDPLLIAEAFNDYFSNIASTLQVDSRSIPDLSPLANFIENRIPPNVSFELKPINRLIVQKELQALQPKAVRLDGVGQRILKLSAPIIASSVSKIINTSITSGKFPSQWKNAKIFCLHKAGDISNCSNYRPISLLPVVSKIIERYVSNSLSQYLDRFNLISPNQSGFRKKHNCETALLKVSQYWYDCLNNKEIVGLVALDFRKAFDLVNHCILLKKLELYKLTPKTLDWFTSYLTDRTQSVYYKNTLSSPKTFQSGVPQGSILGPLLFLIFINDLVFSISESKKTLYADDCTIYATDCCLDIVNSKLNRDVESIAKWCSNNHMIINIHKSYTMVISTRQKIAHSVEKDLSIKYRDFQLKSVSSHGYLGIEIDNRLSWSPHIRMTIKKLNLRLSILSRIKKFLPFSARMTYYHAYIASYLNYASSVWGGAALGDINLISTIQKRCSRIILDIQTFSSHKPLFERLKWLPITDYISYRCLMIFKAVHDLVPKYIKDMLCKTSSINTHSMTTRSSDNFYLPKPHISLFKKSFAYI